MSPPPAVGDHLLVDFRKNDKVLILTFNRPKQLNTMTDALEKDLGKVLDWFEEEPSAWVVIITGNGRAFCAGQDLKDWLRLDKEASTLRGSAKILASPNGFGNISRRRSRKPIILALNGLALGGGAEILANCDIVIGSEGQVVGYPEVRRGVVASVGGIPNLIRRAPALGPYLLTGIPIPPHLVSQHLLTEIVPKPGDVLPAALKWAQKIVECSPDAVQVTKEQINLAVMDGEGVAATVTKSAQDDRSAKSYEGANQREGLVAFNEKRDPKWSDPPRYKRDSKL